MYFFQQGIIENCWVNFVLPWIEIKKQKKICFKRLKKYNTDHIFGLCLNILTEVCKQWSKLLGRLSLIDVVNNFVPTSYHHLDWLLLTVLLGLLKMKKVIKRLSFRGKPAKESKTFLPLFWLFCPHCMWKDTFS